MTLHTSGELLHNRYRVLNPLGRGGLGFTYAARDLKTHQPVALKILSLKRSADWKKLELFEREAKVLAQLDHPAIPQYIDYFQIDTKQDRGFYIVQQLAPGKPLDRWIDQGWRPGFQAVEKIATQLLKILIHLQELLPPVIHRDIKPQNIILHDSGDIFLVDFGSVQDTYRQSITQGSTVVGTFGYMAPEQFRGQAVPSTDLYGLGSTLLFLLTAQSPAELPQRRLKIDFRPALPTQDPFFADWLERLITPSPDHRFATAQDALNALHGKLPLPSPPEAIAKPLNTPIQLHKTPNTLSVTIPPIGFRTPQIQRIAIAALLWNSFLGFVVAMMISLQLFLAPTKIISFWTLVATGLLLLVKYVYGALSVTYLELDRQRNTLQMERKLLGSRYKHTRSPLIPSEPMQIKRSRLWPWRKIPFTYCSIRLRSKHCKFGGFLTTLETAWLTQEINSFLQR